MAAQRREIWDGVLEQPWAERLEKPRTAGLTMVIDKGIGLSQTRDLLQMAAAHIDFLKLGFGTSLIYPSEALTRKISLAKEYGVHVYPGGTLLELAVHQGRSAAFLERARELGFTCIEVSEGTIDLPPAKRRELIARGVELGFCVLTEIGKKARGSRPDPAAVRARLLDDLAQGAAYVIIEGRDGGRDVGVYDPAGGMDQRLVDAILAQISAPSRIIWE
ncbi:MAG TPA: phosphosulfolactate synthase, partial [Limnochordia bacterium]